MIARPGGKRKQGEEKMVAMVVASSVPFFEFDNERAVNGESRSFGEGLFQGEGSKAIQSIKNSIIILGQ